MWEVLSHVPLPLTKDSVAAYFGLASPNAVANIRPHAISPNGRYIAGTLQMTFQAGNPHSSRAGSDARGFLLKKDLSEPPGWTIEYDVGMPGTARGVSIRGVNDIGDVVGFYVHNSDNGDPPTKPNRPFARLMDEKPVDIDQVTGVNLPAGEIAYIDNLRNHGGNGSIAGVIRGFTGTIAPANAVTVTPLPETDVTAIRGLNQRGTRLISRTVGANSITYVEFGDVSVVDFAAATGIASPTVNCLNEADQVAGFYLISAGLRRGFLTTVSPSGGVDMLLYPPMPSTPGVPIPDTRLFGISQPNPDDPGGICFACGVRGNVEPFYLVLRSINK